jgi:UDP-glucose 4-epimerase
MSSQGQPIAVIGAGGFLGSALLRRAAQAGVPCAAFTRSTPFLRDGRPAPEIATARTIYWLATSINPAVAESRPEMIAADRAAFVSMLRAVGELPAQPRLVLLSSGGTVYDPSLPPPYHESSPTAPRGAYGRAKLELEELLAGSGLPAVVIRPSNAYGPGQPARRGQGVVAYWLRAVAQGEPITIIGDPGTTRDYVFVDDVSDALLAVHEAEGRLPATINIGAGEATSLARLAELIQQVAGDTRDIGYEPARGFDVPHTWLDVRLAGEALGWRPRTSLPAGLTATWRALRDDLAAPVAIGRRDYNGAP